MTFEELQAQVQALTAQLQAQQTTGRTSEIRKPLSNLLYPPPSATVAKPNFFFEGMNSVERTQPGPFPALRFRLTEEGVEERAIRSQAEMDALGPEWQMGVPVVEAPGKLDEVEDALASLTPDERAAVLAESHVQRRSAITAKLAALPLADLAGVADASAAPRKRGPGRPRKV